MIIRTTRDLGALVRDTRKRRSMTQLDLATRAGVSRKWLIDLEAGKRTSELSLVLRTLNALSIDLRATEREKARGRDGDLDSIIDTSRRTRS